MHAQVPATRACHLHAARPKAVCCRHACHQPRFAYGAVVLSVQKVECLAFDAGSNTVWTGHADGTIRLHQVKHAATESADLQCNVAVATCCQDVPVRSLAIEIQDHATQPRCWAGDAQGRVCVRQLWPGLLGPQLLDKVTGELNAALRRWPGFSTAASIGMEEAAYCAGCMPPARAKLDLLVHIPTLQWFKRRALWAMISCCCLCCVLQLRPASSCVSHPSTCQ